MTFRLQQVGKDLEFETPKGKTETVAFLQGSTFDRLGEKHTVSVLALCLITKFQSLKLTNLIVGTGCILLSYYSLS